MPEGSRPTARLARFGVFEFDIRAGELRKAGRRVRLSGQPIRILQRLVEARGDLVTRDELRRELWPADTFVDFERGLNSAMKRLRAALGDSADAPRFIETLPKRGYRLLVAVELPEAASASLEEGVASRPVADEARRARTRWVPGLVALVVVAAAVLGVALRPRELAGPPEVRSVAVLPFVVAGPQASSDADDYVAFTLADALITELYRLDHLRVISRTSSMQYRRTEKRLPEIARELNADIVIEGAILRDGRRIKTTLQMIDATSDRHLWAESYEREADDGLALAAEVAHTAARAIHRQLAPTAPPVRQAAPARAPVWEAYMKGRYHLSRATEADFARARAYFEQALALDDRHAPSHSGLADYYTINDSLSPGESLRLARHHALRAIELDGALPDAHTSLAFVAYYGDWDWERADLAFRRALELNPDHARARRWYALFCAAMGRFEEAEQHVAHALTVDPVALASHDAAAAITFNARRFADAAAIARSMIDLDPFDVRGYEHLTLASIQLGQYEQSLHAAERAIAIVGDDPLQQAFRAMALGRLGRTAEAHAILAGLALTAEARHVPDVIVAIARTDVGQAEQALDALDRALEGRDPYLVLLHVSPWFDPLRQHPRFQSIHRRLRFPPRGS